MKTSFIIAISVGLVGAVVVIVSSVLGFSVLPKYIKKKTEEEVALRPLSDTWNKWANIDKPLYSDFYIFSVSNPNEVESGALPNFVQKGPYSYRQRRRKINLSQLEGERTVTYEQETWYQFDTANSRGNSEDDLVNVINIPLVSFLTVVNNTSPEFVPIAHALLAGETLIQRDVRVGDLLFYGMNVDIYVTVMGQFGFPVPPEYAGGLFSLYKGRNGTTDGVYKIHTGVGDIENFGQIITYNDKNYLGFWNHMSPCDRVNGSDGTIFPPFVEKSRIVELFSSDIYRSIYLKYESEQEILGIKGYKFILPREVLEDPRRNASNRCFCNKADIADCLYSGAIDVSTIRNGAPLVFSTPYFLDGHQKYSQDSLLWPSKAAHETALVIEPNSGALLRANKRIQLNVNYKPFSNDPQLDMTSEVMFPAIWVDENTEFTEENAKELKDKLLSPKKAVETWRWVGVGVGIALILVGMALYVWKGS